MNGGKCWRLICDGKIVWLRRMESGRQEAGEEAEWAVVAGEDVGCGAGSIDTQPMSYCLKFCEMCSSGTGTYSRRGSQVLCALKRPIKLEIEFRSGACYQYYGVSISTYRGLMFAGSKGRFFHSRIRNGHFRYREV
jgi:hypothetical protein